MNDDTRLPPWAMAEPNIKPSDIRDWGFPELSEEENREITRARMLSWSAFYPCVTGPVQQAQKTLQGAREWLHLRQLSIDKWREDNPP